MTKTTTAADLTRWIASNIKGLNESAGVSEHRSEGKPFKQMFCFDLTMEDNRRKSFVDNIVSLCRTLNVRISKVDSRDTLFDDSILVNGKPCPIDNHRKNKVIIHFKPA